MQVHQFHPTASFGDGVSNQMLILQRLLREQGYGSEIFCEQLPLHYEGRARPIADYAQYSSPENVLLSHYTMVYSSDVLSRLQALPDRKVLVYHNITPHRYFAGVNEHYYEAARRGREQLAQIRPLFDAGWGVSAFNSQDLAQLGWEDPDVLPTIVDPNRYNVRPDRRVLRRWRQRPNVLFVGRVSPNKRFEDLILAFHYLKRDVRPDANLLLVGSGTKMGPYPEYLHALTRRLGLADVVFTGHVSTAELVAYYRCASCYLSMSEHEGFGVPLVESMIFGVPVVAYAAAAVPETLGGCGVLVHEKRFAEVAELIGLILDDPALRAKITARQRERAETHTPERVGPRLTALLARFRESAVRTTR